MPERSKADKLVSDINPEEVLRQWGKIAPMEIEVAGPIHPKIKELLKLYDWVGPDKYFKILDRSLAKTPFVENTNFVQIGMWGDGSEILAKRDESDGRIYLAQIEDSDPKNPTILASTTTEFFQTAWAYHQDSLRR